MSLMFAYTGNADFRTSNMLILYVNEIGKSSPAEPAFETVNLSKSISVGPYTDLSTDRPPDGGFVITQPGWPVLYLYAFNNVRPGDGGFYFDWGMGGTSATFYGGDYGDALIGGSANDFLNGHSGTDTLVGNAGDDMLVGEDGTDSLNGGDGNDYLEGGDGNDTLNGGAGNDTLEDEAGDDTISGGDGNEWMGGGEGNDTLYGDGGNDVLNGEDGDDALHGGDGDDTLYGQAGDNTLNGDAGSDALYGGDSNDTLYGGDDSDFLIGADGDDTLMSGNGADILNGGAGADIFKGTVDELTYDTIQDFAFGDTLIISDANLSALNGLAPSAFITLPNGKTVAVTGYTYGYVWSATYSAATGTTLSLATHSVSENSKSGTSVGTVGTTQTSSSAQAKVAAGAIAESADGSSLIHTLVDDAGGRFAINRTTGEITVRNGLLLDYEQDQSHTIRVRVTDSDGHSEVKEFTVVVANEDPESVRGDAGANTLVGGALADTFRGGRGNDSLKGGAGGDTLRGEAGNDRLHGGEGADTFVFTRNTGQDRVLDFSADEGDELDFSAFGYASARALLADAEQQGEHVQFVLDGGDKVILSNVDLNTLRENQDLFLV